MTTNYQAILTAAVNLRAAQKDWEYFPSSINHGKRCKAKADLDAALALPEPEAERPLTDPQREEIRKECYRPTCADEEGVCLNNILFIVNTPAPKAADLLYAGRTAKDWHASWGSALNERDSERTANKVFQATIEALRAELTKLQEPPTPAAPPRATVEAEFSPKCE